MLLKLPLALLLLLPVPLLAQSSPTSQPATKPAWTGPLSPPTLPGNNLADHPFFYAGEWNYPKPQQSMFIIKDGHIAWQYDIPSKDANNQISEFSDATLLPDGSVVFAAKTFAAKISAEKKVLWSYTAPKNFEVHVIQPVGPDKIMYVQNGNPATLTVLNLVTNKVETQFTLPTGNPTKTHGQFRRVRVTPAGTFLAAHMDNNKVAEYDNTGKEIWSLDIPSPWAAVRLATGNTLISSNKGFIREVTPDKKTVWEFTQADVPTIKLFSIQEANRLSNGNTVITNWCPNGIKNPADWPQSVQALEVTPDKKCIWALRAWTPPADLGPATAFQRLDDPSQQR